MARSIRILVVDDDASVVDWLVEELVSRGYVAEGVTDAQAAIASAHGRHFDLVVSDVEMPSLRGLDLVRALQAKRPEQLVVLITAFGSIDLAMEAVRAGAADFLAKPFPVEALIIALERALRERRMKREIVRLRHTTHERPEASEIVARSAAMQRVLQLAQRVSSSTSTVLLTGESGVGKTAIARMIHESGPRRRKPFLQLNCAALPANLVEAELFGVAKGAFTDAREDRAGLFTQADGGTLLLDEVGEMPMEVQAKLLTVLESGQVRPLGGRAEQAVDVRIIAATNQALELAMREQRMRPDLYHRLNVIRLEVPPLRERPEDIPLLVDRFLDRLAPRTGRQILGVQDDVMRWLCAQPWPGNVRELANALERAMLLADHDVLVLNDFLAQGQEAGDPGYLRSAALEEVSLDEMQQRYIRAVLDAHGGSKAKAARVLGIDRTTLWRRLGQED